MRYLVLSDIHANRIAFEAVLRHAGRQRWDEAIFLGDIVGYYTEPEEVVGMLRELKPSTCLLGNHDAWLLELTEGKSNAIMGDGVVGEVISEHARLLSEASLSFLNAFQMRAAQNGWEAVHGALRTPWEYISSLLVAQQNLPLMESELCFVGHTHVPVAYACINSEQGELWRTVSFRGERSVYRLPPGARVLFNPGSVGQPRDGVPLASYAIYDEAARLLELFRVPFDLLGVQRQVRASGYPETLATRLELGR
jgi:predicted phosphodiesterase